MKISPSITELEMRMRPDAWSHLGFLGPNESLEIVIVQDTQTLNNLGISQEQIADSMEKMLITVLEQYDKDSKSGMRKEMLHFDLTNAENPAYFKMDNLPDIDKGYLQLRDIQIFFTLW